MYDCFQVRSMSKSKSHQCTEPWSRRWSIQTRRWKQQWNTQLPHQCQQMLEKCWTKGSYVKNNKHHTQVTEKSSITISKVSTSHTIEIMCMKRGTLGFVVLTNFSCSILVISVLNCGIAVFSKPAGYIFLGLLVDNFNLPFDCFNNHKVLPLFPNPTTCILPLFLPLHQQIRQLYWLTLQLRYFPDFFLLYCGFAEFFVVMQCSASLNVPLHEQLYQNKSQLTKNEKIMP